MDQLSKSRNMPNRSEKIVNDREVTVLAHSYFPVYILRAERE